MEGGDIAVLLGHQAGLVGKTGTALVRDAARFDAGKHVEHRRALAVHFYGDRQPPAILVYDVVVESVLAGFSVGVDVGDAGVLRMDFPNVLPRLEQIRDAKLEEAFMPQDDTAVDRVPTRSLGLLEWWATCREARVRGRVAKTFRFLASC